MAVFPTWITPPGRLRGLFRQSVIVNLVATQAAGSYLVTLRAADATKFLAINRLTITTLQTGACTAAIFATIRIRKPTGFSADHTANATALTPLQFDGSLDAVTASGMCVTTSGVAAGMTGGTIGAVGASAGQLMTFYQATLPTGAAVPGSAEEFITDADPPLIVRPGEGIAVLNDTLLGAAASAAVKVQMSWGEYLPS